MKKPKNLKELESAIELIAPILAQKSEQKEISITYRDQQRTDLLSKILSANPKIETLKVDTDKGDQNLEVQVKNL